MSRYQRSEVDFDARYDDRRSTQSGGRSRYDDHYAETDVNFRTGSGHLPKRETVLVKERDRESDRRGSTPAFLRDDYGQTSAGAMVLRARDREDITYAAPRRRRSPTPERQERDEIIIRREERTESRPPAARARRRSTSQDREEIIIRREERSESVPPAPRRARPREQSLEREEIIIRREERSQSRPAAPRYRERERSVEREEIIIRRDEREDYAPPRRSTTAPIHDVTRDREEIIIRREERDDSRSQRSYRPAPPPPAPPANDIDRQEIIIRRDRIDSDNRPARDTRKPRWEDDPALSRPISHERARGRSDSFSEEEIIIRRDEREGRAGETSRQEIIIRKTSRSRSRSPSPAASMRSRPAPAPMPAPEPQVIYAPQIHQEVITHHRHVDHGYELRGRIRKENQYSRPPSPSPPPAPLPPAMSVRSLSEERIDIRRSEMRNGRREEEKISIRERSRSRGPPPPRFQEREEVRQDNFNLSISRNEISEPRAPPPREEVRHENLEIAISRNRGGYESDEEIDYRKRELRPRPIPEPEPEPPVIGPRYGARRDPRDGLWTELTKDLVVKEAIREMGYEYEETEEFYYVFKYMTYADVARLVGLSEDIRRDRHKRLNEIRWENAVSPRPAIAPASPRVPLALEGPPARDRGGWERDEERYVEREVIYRGGRPPPPVGWRGR